MLPTMNESANLLCQFIDDKYIDNDAEIPLKK